MPSTIFSGQKIKTLKDTLTLNGKSDIISSTTDPTASAVDAPIGSLLINQTSGKLYRKLDAGSSTNWEEVGSGVGGINYILNPSAEVNTTGWATYADAAGASPVDGTGGSPTITWARSTTSPLRGVADFNLTKGASNVQGQGVSYDFTIDEADKAKVLTVSFDYEVLSGTYADGDLTVYLIADPAGTPVVIQPAGYTVLSATAGTTMKQQATFQTQATGTSYRLCFHIASTSASAYTLAIDNVVVGPQTRLYGSPITDLTPVPTANLGTFTGLVASSRQEWTQRIGDQLRWVGRINTTTTGATLGQITVGIPYGYQLDTSKMDSAVIPSGAATLVDASTVGVVGVAIPTSSNVLIFTSDAAAWNSSTGVPATITYDTADFIRWDVTIPIAGWSSSVEMSQDTDTRVVAATLIPSAATTLTTSVALLDFVKETDTHNAFDNTSKAYVVPVSGYYKISANPSYDITTAGANCQVRTNVYVDTVLKGEQRSAIITAASFVAVPITYCAYFNAGQSIQIYARFVVSGSVGTLLNSPSGSRVTIERLSGPATIAASETVACKYYELTGGDSIGTSLTTIVYSDRDFDTHGAYNSSTGTWTCPVSGKYLVQAKVLTAAVTLSTTQRIYIAVNDGTERPIYGSRQFGAGVSRAESIFLSGVIRCNAGDTFTIGANSSIATAVGVSGASEDGENFVSFERIGN